MKSQLQISAAMVALASLTQPLLAWNSFGHMAVAGAAYRNLDSETQKKVNKLLALNPYYKTKWASEIPANTASGDRARLIFMLAATWPDAIKTDPD